jgi:hypothetical protein
MFLVTIYSYIGTQKGTIFFFEYFDCLLGNFITGIIHIVCRKYYGKWDITPANMVLFSNPE